MLNSDLFIINAVILFWLHRITIMCGIVSPRQEAGNECARRVATGKTEEFSKLYDEYMPKVYRYIFFRLRNQQLTEDLTSEVFEKALVNYPKYENRRASFSTWIFTIARNTVIDSYKTNKRSRLEPLEDAVDLPTREPGPEDALESSEEKRQLVDCVGALPAREQEIIRLKFGARMNNREIGRLMGLSESNVGTILGRSLGKLRLKLTENSK